MFARSILIFCLIFLLASCALTRRAENNQNVFSGKVSLCGGDDEFKVHATIDSSSVVRLKFYSDAGFKLAEIILSSDSCYVSYCISEQIQKSINFQLNKFSRELCLNRLACDFFQNKLFSAPQTCYNILSLPNSDGSLSYSILSLTNSPLVTIEQTLKKKNGILPHYRIFNQFFCIQFFINKR